MSTSKSNLPRTIEEVSAVQDTNTFFNNLYNIKLELGTNANDAVQTYFQEVTGEIESAKLLAATVMYTALSRGVDPMSMLEKFKKLPRGQLDLYLATFMNLSRVNTSLLGIKNQPQTGYFVQRMILA